MQATLNNKNDLREFFKEQRKFLPRNQIQNLSNQIFDRVISLNEFKNSSILHTYISTSEEVNTNLLILTAINQRKEVIVPFLNQSMEMVHYLIRELNDYKKINKLNPLKANNFDNINLIKPEEILTEKNIILIPLVAFDKNCNRLGSGKGYYDRFLAPIRSIKIGLAFENQKATKIPVTKWDIKLDMIITEKKIYST